MLSFVFHVKAVITVLSLLKSLFRPPAFEHFLYRSHRVSFFFFCVFSTHRNHCKKILRTYQRLGVSSETGVILWTWSTYCSITRSDSYFQRDVLLDWSSSRCDFWTTRLCLTLNVCPGTPHVLWAVSTVSRLVLSLIFSLFYCLSSLYFFVSIFVVSLYVGQSVRLVEKLLYFFFKTGEKRLVPL